MTLKNAAGNTLTTIEGFSSPSGGKDYFTANQNGYQISGGGNNNNGNLDGAGTITLPNGSSGSFNLSKS